jgi:NitT/TauT family transport system substrate-binding protein
MKHGFIADASSNPREDALRAVYLACATIIALCTAASPPAQAETLQTVRVGIIGVISDAGILIADAKGYFRDEGLSVSLINFSSGAYMVAPLGSGELDAGGGSAAAGLYNAVARGIKIRIVADKASSLPGYPVNRLVVRKQYVDNGRYKSLADLKGMKIGNDAPGVAAGVTLDTALKRGGLTRADITIPNMQMSDYVAAMKNGALDGAMATEPFGTIAINQGIAAAVASDDQLIPGHQIANLLYSEDFATKHRDAAIRFMKAYLRGVRFYNGALKDGHLAGPNADEVIGILTRSTRIKDAALYREIIPNGCDPDGFINVKTLKLDFDDFRASGLIHGNVTVDEVVDHSFLDAALRDIGRYHPESATK